MKRASAIVEYAIILGVVGLALMTMNIYIQRGMQGKVKDMADHFITGGKQAQVDQVDPDVTTTIDSTILSANTLTNETFKGGGKKLVFLDTTTIKNDSTTVERGDKRPNSDFTPAEAGQLAALTRGEDSDFIDDDLVAESDGLYGRDLEKYTSDWEKSENIKYLTQERDKFLNKAKALEEKSVIVEEKAKEVLQQIATIIGKIGIIVIIPVPISWVLKIVDRTLSWPEADEIMSYAHPGFGNQQREILQAGIQIYRAGKDVSSKAEEMLQTAVEYRETAAKIQEKIDLLNWS